ncbi:DDB1- and CUL4-associated factor 12-like isoform X2 [Oscarella lobularis]|uniref:DDB1- and CUL4-associated factor 12-like isoform X2 n=1 Tax=Oscarella lobularis TaxID=121494 RepID=UPI003313D435
MDVPEYVRTRAAHGAARLNSEYKASSLPARLQEREIRLDADTDKVFASEWLSNTHVVCGTKCNQLLVIDVERRQTTSIPTLDPHPTMGGPGVRCHCGIHDIAVSPRGDFLATGGRNANDLAVYRMPFFDPHLVGHNHRDWIFALTWIDENYVVTGSRDSTVSVWCMRSGRPGHECDGCRSIRSSPRDEFGTLYSRPALTKSLHNERVRALAHSKDTEILGILSSSSLHFWDSATFQSIGNTRLPHAVENVSLARHPTMPLYANGSQNHITFVDERDFKLKQSVNAPDHRHDPGVRSLSFYENILTVGGGRGKVAFFDVRACKYLERQDDTKSFCYLDTGPGHLREDPTYLYYFSEEPRPPNAVYTHCYDRSHSRLFTGGGPPQLGLFGNYAAIWQ